ncbi:NepR family anti-sigma factor [Sphingopyxis sp. MWB1]|uniref:NepR family anti-sigma factor n=1 Tax=Sphingopyxis sp. MWB1 TaxID=1537715 RepID=UPI00051A1611|nr:NepR family anti-sigma factor [Sphingopyxis sp. MWB1]
MNDRAPPSGSSGAQDSPSGGSAAHGVTKGSFPGTDSDQWHRTLTGRQSPEPVTAKLRMIYGNILAEKLPDQMLDLLAELDQKSAKQ